jgi:DNA polymerase
VQTCQGCDLYERATQAVFGAGPRTARLLLVGEQPGDVEDREGEPFVGPAGHLLDRALAEAGIDRASAFLTNAVKHFRWKSTSSGKRRIHEKPSAGQVTACRPWLGAEIGAVHPALIVCLGSTAVQAVLGPDVRVMRDRGAVLDRDSAFGLGSFVVTVHPSSVLRAPGDRRDEAYQSLVADLRVAAQAL